jgi:hypothetical protein
MEFLFLQSLIVSGSISNKILAPAFFKLFLKINFQIFENLFITYVKILIKIKN